MKFGDYKNDYYGAMQDHYEWRQLYYAEKMDEKLGGLCTLYRLSVEGEFCINTTLGILKSMNLEDCVENEVYAMWTKGYCRRIPEIIFTIGLTEEKYKEFKSKLKSKSIQIKLLKRPRIGKDLDKGHKIVWSEVKLKDYDDNYPGKESE